VWCKKRSQIRLCVSLKAKPPIGRSLFLALAHVIREWFLLHSVKVPIKAMALSSYCKGGLFLLRKWPYWYGISTKSNKRFHFMETMIIILYRIYIFKQRVSLIYERRNQAII
jgi:hypothetical protein